MTPWTWFGPICILALVAQNEAMWASPSGRCTVSRELTSFLFAKFLQSVTGWSGDTMRRLTIFWLSMYSVVHILFSAHLIELGRHLTGLSRT